jgi:glucan phosphorylase
LIDKYFGNIWAELDHRDQSSTLKTGSTLGETFVMPVLALKLSERANAVSELHASFLAYVAISLA